MPAGWDRLVVAFVRRMKPGRHRSPALKGREGAYCGAGSFEVILAIPANKKRCDGIGLTLGPQLASWT